jgi:hypothetical protein
MRYFPHWQTSPAQLCRGPGSDAGGVPASGKGCANLHETGFLSSASTSYFVELGSFPHCIEGDAGVRVDDFNTVLGGISRRRRIAARGRVRRVERGRAEGESKSEGASRRPNGSRASAQD